jgi:hypothetical protein
VPPAGNRNICRRCRQPDEQRILLSQSAVSASSRSPFCSQFFLVIFSRNPCKLCGFLVIAHDTGACRGLAFRPYRCAPVILTPTPKDAPFCLFTFSPLASYAALAQLLSQLPPLVAHDQPKRWCRALLSTRRHLGGGTWTTWCARRWV